MPDSVSPTLTVYVTSSVRVFSVIAEHILGQRRREGVHPRLTDSARPHLYRGNSAWGSGLASAIPDCVTTRASNMPASEASTAPDQRDRQPIRDKPDRANPSRTARQPFSDIDRHT